MAGYTNFDRQYRLIAGPEGKKGFEVGEVTEEQPVPLHITFSLEKSDLETQNTGKIEIYNLSKSHVNVLEKSNCCVGLKAGYGNNLSLIFAGVVSFASTKVDGADVKTEIEVIDNLISAQNTYVSVSYKGKVNWKTIVEDVAAQMGVVPTYSHNASFKNVSKGYSYVGLAKNVLKKACDSNGLSWSIQNGVLQIKKKGDSMSRRVYVISAESGMIGSPERVSIADSNDTSKTKIGYDVTYFLNGAIDINDYVRLESREITGYFYVYSLQISGDNVTGDWICKARLLELAKPKESKKKTKKKNSTKKGTKTYKVSTSGGKLMLRKSAGYTKVLKKIPNGTKVTSDGKKSGHWVHVCYNGTWGYSYDSYLKKA